MIGSQLKRKRYEIVPYSGVYTMPYSNQSSRRTVFISYRIQMIFMPVSCRRKANPVFFHTVFVSYRHRVNGVLDENLKSIGNFSSFKKHLKLYMLFNFLS